MTKREEKLVLDKFKELYCDLPQGEFSHVDSPDFILVTLDRRKIGIELTQAVHSKSAKRQSSSQIELTDLALKELVSQLPYHFSLSIKLIPGKGVPKPKRKQIVSATVAFCVNEFLDLQNRSFSRVEHVNVDLDSILPEVRNLMLNKGYRNLPEGIASISLLRYDEHGSSFNSASEAAFIPFFTFERLQERLSDKERKLPKYKPCDAYWLIIWQGAGITGYFKEVEFENPIQSKFDKVFLIRDFKHELITLKP